MTDARFEEWKESHEERHERQFESHAEKHATEEKAHDVVHAAHEREHLIVSETTERARQIQFNEYARRLDDLNHAHKQAIEAQRMTVPRETFEQRVSEVDRRLDLVEKALVAATSSREGVSSTIRWAFAAIAALAAIIGLLVLLQPPVLP